MEEEVDYTVRVYWREHGAPEKWPHYVTSFPTLMRAQHCAQNMRAIFGCGAWIEEFDRPATLPLLRVRQTIELMKLAKAEGR